MIKKQDKIRKRKKRVAMGRKRRLVVKKIAGKKRTYKFKKKRPAETAADAPVIAEPPQPVPVAAAAPEPRAHADRFEEGYKIGVYDGGEKLLSDMLPAFTILPELTVRDVIAAGFEQVRHRLYPLLDPFTVFREMQQALNMRKPLSLVRLGDGELLTLAHDKVVSADQALREGPFLKYAGVDIPDPEAGDLLAQSIRQATIIGIPVSRSPNFQQLLFPVLHHYQIGYSDLRMTISTMNYLLYQLGYLTMLMEGRRVLLVGNAAPALSGVLARRCVQVAGVVAPVNGMKDIQRVMAEVAQYDFDMALVAAGIPAVVISQRIASELGKVALDFGHLANKIATGESI
ncbi:GT-D fold domain-containing glycosyltransferase [Paenibacillus sp. CECT 9249]|uniref:GT-D fold domain-containing protein n=1 Tax=unclassified Paenibacillus TaxID=185978 RepID=UPI001E28EBB8|nr:GT-D fold domain-containing glycosyltransferase [Paenibacillus sp. CECT 9249]CAH0118460.1 hypothetical protein PAE9249_00949 [Paenibacillus sp. CECT 9249]